jgi:hypothetical protein
MPADPYAIVTRDGKKVDAITDAALKRAEKILGRKITVTQGSYNAGGVKASAGTHDGGGVVDCPAWDADETVIALRAVGFAAWHRPAIPNLWPEHIHAVLIGNAKLAPVAFRQVQAYLQRRDGLKSNAIDTDPGWTNIARYTVESFRADVLREERQAKLETAKARGAKWKRWLDRNRAYRARLRKALRK